MSSNAGETSECSCRLCRAERGELAPVVYTAPCAPSHLALKTVMFYYQTSVQKTKWACRVTVHRIFAVCDECRVLLVCLPLLSSYILDCLLRSIDAVLNLAMHARKRSRLDSTYTGMSTH